MLAGHGRRVGHDWCYLACSESWSCVVWVRGVGSGVGTLLVHRMPLLLLKPNAVWLRERHWGVRGSLKSPPLPSPLPPAGNPWGGTAGWRTGSGEAAAPPLPVPEPHHPRHTLSVAFVCVSDDMMWDRAASSRLSLQSSLICSCQGRVDSNLSGKAPTWGQALLGF